MISATVSESSGLGSSPSWEHCVVFLGKSLYSQRASLHPGVQMDTAEFNAADYTFYIQLMRIEKLTIWPGIYSVIQLNSLNLC